MLVLAMEVVLRARAESMAAPAASSSAASNDRPARDASIETTGASNTERTLERLESWFQAEIVRPHESRALGNASRSANAAGSRAETAAQWVLPSRHLQAKERVAIYSRMYFSRLVECLQADYPAVAHLAGEHAFEKLARAYLLHHPSRHYSLNPLGAHLPEFLAGRVRVPRRPLLHDVARLELLMTEVFDAAQSPVLKSTDLGSIAPEAWESARPRLIDAMRLATFDHRANAIVTAARQGEPLPDLSRRKTWVAIYRKDYVVWRMELTQPMHAALSAFAERKTLHAAIEAGARMFRGTPQELEGQISGWFAEWVGEGLFSSIE
jgi:hypothetical protein